MRIYHFLDFWAREQPDAEFAVQESQSLTYAKAAAAGGAGHARPFSLELA